uniref:Uncharacterized protein n=1 Tax=Panagrolaimus sp. PS1159 TaxID=55785 RepID=A0AC35GWR9_9BILA
MDDSEEDESCSHYQINLQQFKQTIREKANLGFRSLGRMSYTARRSIQFIDELPPSHEEICGGGGGSQIAMETVKNFEEFVSENFKFQSYSENYRQVFRPSAGSLSPPNTPSSSESSSSGTSNHGNNAIEDPQKLLTETIRKQAQKPSGGENGGF